MAGLRYAVVAVSIVGLAACGGSATSGPTAAPPVSQTATPSKAPAQAATAKPPLAATAAQSALLEPISKWDRTFRTVPAAECAAAGTDRPVGTEHAWQLPNGGVACVDYQGANGVWGDHIISVDIYFQSPVPEQQAVVAATGLMPRDVVRAATFDGVNANYSDKPNGSCRQIVYTSPTLRARVTSLDSAWKEDPAKATVYLYSGITTAANGSDHPYDPHRVHLSSLLISGENRGVDGAVHC